MGERTNVVAGLPAAAWRRVGYAPNNKLETGQQAASSDRSWIVAVPFRVSRRVLPLPRAPPLPRRPRLHSNPFQFPSAVRTRLLQPTRSNLPCAGARSGFLFWRLLGLGLV